MAETRGHGGLCADEDLDTETRRSVALVQEESTLPQPAPYRQKPRGVSGTTAT